MQPESDSGPNGSPMSGASRWLWIGAAIGIGLLIAFVIGGGEDPAPPPTIEWIELASIAEDSTGWVVAGPGGFVSTVNGIEFSANGHSWTAIELRRPNGRPVEGISTDFTIQATEEVWMVERVTNRKPGIWLSRDGKSWTRHNLDSEFAGDVLRIQGTADGFFATTILPTRYFWSDNGMDWTPVDPPFEEVRGTWTGVFVTQDGVSALQLGNGWKRFDMYQTTDGIDWTNSSVDEELFPINEVTRMVVERVGDSWMLLGGRLIDSQSPNNRPEVVWTSSDGENWVYQGSPDLTGDGGFVVAPIAVDDVVVFPVVVEAVAGDQVHQWWVTRDGITWDSVAGPTDIATVAVIGNNRVHTLAGTRNDDGSYTIVYVTDRTPMTIGPLRTAPLSG